MLICRSSDPVQEVVPSTSSSGEGLIPLEVQSGFTLPQGVDGTRFLLAIGTVHLFIIQFCISKLTLWIMFDYLFHVCFRNCNCYIFHYHKDDQCVDRHLLSHYRLPLLLFWLIQIRVLRYCLLMIPHAYCPFHAWFIMYSSFGYDVIFIYIIFNLYPITL